MSILKDWKKNLDVRFLLVLLLILILLGRFLYLDYGLPYIQQADEVELVEYPLNYAVNIKKIFHGDYEFFKPFSFVYGTFPAYLNTLLLVPFLKFTSFFELSQDRYFIYLYLRVIYALFSIFSCLGVYFVAKELTKDRFIPLLASLLVSLNYTFLWLSKYLNNDSLIVLFTIWFVYFYLKFSKSLENKFLYLSIFFIALGISTKITFIIVLLYPVIDLVLKKKFKEIIFSSLLILFVYLVTNPFTFIFPQEFFNRVLEMRIKENGIVVDSFNTSPFKYLNSVYLNLGLLITIFGFYKIYLDFVNKKIDVTTITAIVFILFFSISQRLVDRWVVPIYFILIINSLLIIYELKGKLLQKLILLTLFLVFANKFIGVNLELSENAPMRNSYLFFKDKYFLPEKRIYIVTEKGLNPYFDLGKKGMGYFQAPVVLYESEGAFKSFPDNPKNYDFIIFSTKVRDYYLNPYIQKINPQYSNKWETFYLELTNSNNFEIVGFFGSNNPSLINKENILIFRKK